MLKKTTKVILEYALIILLGAFLALGYILFVVPNDFAPAGINGVAVMVQYKLNFSVGFMSLLINVPLCVLAFFLVEKRFAVKTFVFVLAYSLVYLILQKLDLSRFQYDAEGVDTVYPVIIAGLIAGVVYGLLFRLNSCSGGTDIIAKYVAKRNPYLNFFWVTFIFNAVVAVASFFVYAKVGESGTMIYDYKPVCLCVLYCFVSSFLANVMQKGYKTAYKFIIITDDTSGIEKEIIEKLHHSATKLKATGVYAHGDKEMLICLVNKHQIIDFQNIIKKYPNTFAFVETVGQTFGNFKRIKQHIQ